MAIDNGSVASYGDVARRAGCPGCARLVGRLLAEASADAALPWHRVVKSDGRIAFAVGSSAFREQVRRLKAEGVRVVAGRVALVSGRNRDADLDAALWGHLDRSGSAKPARVKRRSTAGP